jgi:hypothetical protein
VRTGGHRLSPPECQLSTGLWLPAFRSDACLDLAESFFTHRAGQHRVGGVEGLMRSMRSMSRSRTSMANLRTPSSSRFDGASVRDAAKALAAWPNSKSDKALL